jgi:hypothetical protein
MKGIQPDKERLRYLDREICALMDEGQYDDALVRSREWAELNSRLEEAKNRIVKPHHQAVSYQAKVRQ